MINIANKHVAADSIWRNDHVFVLNILPKYDNYTSHCYFNVMHNLKYKIVKFLHQHTK